MGIKAVSVLIFVVAAGLLVSGFSLCLISGLNLLSQNQQVPTSTSTCNQPNTKPHISHILLRT
jgi:hypothetical protein